MRFIVAIALAVVALLSGMDTGATAGQRGIVDSWDIFDDGCRSGYLEYRADGGFGQVYRRNRADWLVDPIWGRGAYRIAGDILISSEEKLDGSIRVQTKQRLSFPDDDTMDVDYLDVVWIDDVANTVKAVKSFSESWTRCPSGALDDVTPVTALVDFDPTLLIGRWGWERGCTTGYVEFTRDGSIRLVDHEPDDDDTFEYGFYEIKQRTLLEVYAYKSGIWKSESHFAFDDRGRLFFSDGMNPTWSEPSGATEDSDPFFEVLFNCADDETSVTGVMPEAAPGEEPLPVERARAEESTLDEMLFDADVARVSRIIAASKSRCMVEGERPEAAAECIDYVWSALDISGDGLLSLSEIARRHRFAEYLREASADHSDDHAVRTLEPHSHGQNP